MSSFLLIGPLTKDLIIENNNERLSVGGAVFYQSFIFNSFNQNYNIITTLSNKDKNLLNEFPDKSRISEIFKNETLFFKNTYYDNNPNHRKQCSNFANNSVLKENLKSIAIDEFDCVILNPLISTDIPIETIKYLKSFNVPIALAIQGFLRKNQNNEVILSIPNNLEDILLNIDILFLDNVESQFIFNKELSIKEIMFKIANYGVNEVIVTCGDNGSIIYSKHLNKYFKIPAYLPKNIKNLTGAGDTYMASYLTRRFLNHDIEESGNFAAMTSSIKIRNLNHFNKNQKYIENKLKKNNG
jgi:sugar/nucleoside kinase (ribokinase family)